MVGMRFPTTVLLGGKTATGLVVPDEIVEALGAGKRPKVRVSVGGHSYETTVASRSGQFLVPLSAEHREAAALAAGDAVEVDIEPDERPREIAVPSDFAAALAADEGAAQFFASLSFTHRKEWVRWIEDAKKSETRTTRIEQGIAALLDGHRLH